ncbi:Alpha-galactosidase A, partial [termite gut metagenome]
KDTAEEQRYILTPPPAPEPRINGAKITGASPDKPFLFTIATTGTRPMTFTAENLPEGLSLNGETGVITGSCSRIGSYIVPLTASNSAGTCHDTLEIVIGGGLALTPHMGWNSWYIYQLNVTQDIMEKSAQALYDYGLVNFGYTYVNIDDGWEVKNGSNDPIVGGAVRNPDGTIRTNKNFPDMKAMTAYIHRLGLKAGLYSSPGRTTCGEYTASFGNEAQDIQTFVDWEFDFLKYDWCSYGKEAKSGALDELQKPYLLISKLIKAAKRDMILNMCQYGMGEVWKWGKEVGGNSWRTTGDLGADTQNLSSSMFSIGFFQEQIKEYTGPDGWNDPDYLLFGNIYDWKNQKAVLSPYSPSEHYTCMTLWCMMSAPLIFSGEIITLDDFTRNILCNAEVIAVDQDKLGKSGYSIQNEELIDIWKKELHDGSTAIAIFNKKPFGCTVDVDWKALGYTGKSFVRDLWRQKDLGAIQKVTSFDIPRHGCVLLKLSK